MKLTISNVNISIGYSKNKNHTAKLKQKKIVLTRRLKDLCEQIITVTKNNNVSKINIIR